MLTDTVREAVLRYGMVSRGQTVLAAVSGGPDSTAMLHALAALRVELGFTLAAAHLDHGLRAGSGSDAEFVSAMAEGLGVECVCGRANLGEVLRDNPGNVQAAAREARYGFLDETAARLSADRIAVGHTADDQAETYLMRELRGSGAQGLAAIPPVRGAVIRPLIHAQRADIISYLEERGIAWLTDPTNLKPAYLRNELRLDIMPLLKKFNPRLVQTLCNSADVLREEDEFLTGHVESLMPGVVKGSADGFVELDLAGLLGLPEAVVRRVIRLAVARVKGDLLGVGYSHIIEASRSIARGRTGRGIDIPGGVRVEKSYGSLLVYVPEAAGTPEAGFCEALPVPGKAVIASEGITVEAAAVEGAAGPKTYDAGHDAGPDSGPGAALFDLDSLKGELFVRSRRPGDYFCPEGMSGRKKIKDYFIDLKLPRHLRDRAPLLTCGTEVAWVMGRRRDRRFAAREDSRRLLLVSFGAADRHGGPG